MTSSAQVRLIDGDGSRTCYLLSFGSTRNQGAHDTVRVARAIVALAAVSRPSGCRKLKGHDDVYRIRVGAYRVIYSIEDRRIVVVVLKIGRRKHICS